MKRSTAVVGAVVLLAASFAAVAVLVVLFGAVPAANDPVARSASPTAQPAAGPPVDPQEIAWVYVPRVIDGFAHSYELQAGTLADDEPVVDLEVAWEADLTIDIARQPAVGPPVDGAVVSVADDGSTSRVHRLVIARGGRDELLVELEHVVWDIAVAPDGGTAYAALVDRDSRRDLGVVRMLLDGSGTVEQLMPPSLVTAAAPMMEVALVAFDVSLSLSADGRYLVRRSCEAAEGCTVELLDVDTGGTRPIDDSVVGIAANVLVSHRCFEICELLATHLVTGGTIQLADAIVGGVIEHHGNPLIVSALDEGGRMSIEMIDLSDGRRQTLHRGLANAHLSLHLDSDLSLAVPDGYVHVTESVPVGEREVVLEMRHRALLISIETGAVTEVPLAPFRPPLGFGQQG